MLWLGPETTHYRSQFRRGEMRNEVEKQDVTPPVRQDWSFIMINIKLNKVEKTFFICKLNILYGVYIDKSSPDTNNRYMHSVQHNNNSNILSDFTDNVLKTKHIIFLFPCHCPTSHLFFSHFSSVSTAQLQLKKKLPLNIKAWLKPLFLPFAANNLSRLLNSHQKCCSGTFWWV